METGKKVNRNKHNLAAKRKYYYQQTKCQRKNCAFAALRCDVMWWERLKFSICVRFIFWIEFNLCDEANKSETKSFAPPFQLNGDICRCVLHSNPLVLPFCDLGGCFAQWSERCSQLNATCGRFSSSAFGDHESSHDFIYIYKEELWLSRITTILAARFGIISRKNRAAYFASICILYFKWN